MMRGGLYQPGLAGGSRTMTTIGVISDTHGLLRREAIAALEGSDEIVHAGDIGDAAILERLGDIAPVAAVRGNIDHGVWALKLPEAEFLEVDGVSVYVLHILAKLDLKPEAAGIRAVIYGHSHVPSQEAKDGVLYFNPGSAGPKRFHLPVTVGKLIVEQGEIRGEIVELVP
jgi:putative phosphoesterase